MFNKTFAPHFKFAFVRFSKISDLSDKKSEYGDTCFESISLMLIDAELKPMGELAFNFFMNEEGLPYSQLIQYSYSYPVLQMMAKILLPIMSDNDSARNPDYMIVDLKEHGFIDITDNFIKGVLQKHTGYGRKL